MHLNADSCLHSPEILTVRVGNDGIWLYSVEHMQGRGQGRGGVSGETFQTRLRRQAPHAPVQLELSDVRLQMQLNRSWQTSGKVSAARQPDTAETV